MSPDLLPAIGLLIESYETPKIILISLKIRSQNEIFKIEKIIDYKK
jgi:hypothetical protein